MHCNCYFLHQVIQRQLFNKLSMKHNTFKQKLTKKYQSYIPCDYKCNQVNLILSKLRPKTIKEMEDEIIPFKLDLRIIYNKVQDALRQFGLPDVDWNIMELDDPIKGQIDNIKNLDFRKDHQKQKKII